MRDDHPDTKADRRPQEAHARNLGQQRNERIDRPRRHRHAVDREHELATAITVAAAATANTSAAPPTTTAFAPTTRNRTAVESSVGTTEP